MYYIEVYDEKEFLKEYQHFYIHFSNHLTKLGEKINNFEFNQFLANLFHEGEENEVRYAELTYYLKNDEDTSLTIEYKIDANNQIIEAYDEGVQIETD